MSQDWSGGSTRKWRKLRLFILTRDQYRCRVQLSGVCTGKATHVHHTLGRKITGDDPKHLVASCAACNLKTGQPFSPDPGRPDTPVSVSRLSPDLGPEPRPELIWNPDALNAHEWLRPFLSVPADAAPPLYMTRPPADAVGSYGAAAVQWIERTQRITLRWWQALAITRQLEHREDGSLCHRVIVESAPRRAGKSVRLRGLALWRMDNAELFGEVQTIVHTGSDVAICREIQRGAWRWAEEVAGWSVAKANGKEALETPDGDRWLVRSQGAVYGYDVCLGLVDEGWNVSPDTVSEGMEPATLERRSPQLHLTSTSHRRATSTMRTRIQAALTTSDGETLFILWGAPAGSDPSDPEVWRAASPYWSEDRRKLIADKYAKALAGEADPQADDPDPMSGFTAQYLNVWQLATPTGTRGNSAVSEDEWTDLAASTPSRPPDAVAVESWFSDGVSLAQAWKGEQVVVSVRGFATLGRAVEALRASGFAGVPTVGASLRTDPALRGVRSRSGEGRTGTAVQELQRIIGEGALRHDGGDHLTGQVLAARTLPGADGPRMVSTERADAIKAAVWAVARCRAPGPGRPRILYAKTS